LDTYHPNLIHIFSIAQYELGINSLRTVIHDGSSSNYLPVWYSYLRLFNNKINKFVELHDKIQEFALLFTNNDIRFESSLPIEYFPNINEKDFLLDTYNYCIRTAQQLEFKKGITLSGTDKFWHNTGNKEPVQICCTLSKPFEINDIGVLKENIWALMCSNSKFSTVIENNKWIYKPGLFDSYFGLFEFDEKDNVDESLIINKGLNKYIENIWHCDFILNNDKITHILFQFDHGLTDGIGLIKPIVNKIDYYLFNKPIQKTILPNISKLNLFQEIIYTLSFICLSFISLFFNDTYKANRIISPSISTNTISLNKDISMTYTSKLLWNLTQSLSKHTKHQNFIFCIPSVISINRSADKIINNNFVPILLPVSSNMSKEQFINRCKLLKSTGVKLLMFCIQELISMKEWWWLRDKIISKVTAVVSSINVGENMPSIFSGVHIATTTPQPIPFCITAISDTTNSDITVRSHDSKILSSEILIDII
jgi:hypothetical protein